jgi:hypothetical protein
MEIPPVPQELLSIPRTPPLSITAWRAVIVFIALRAGIGAEFGTPVSILIKTLPEAHGSLWAVPAMFSGLLMIGALITDRFQRTYPWTGPLEAISCGLLAALLVFAAIANMVYVPGNHISIATEGGETFYCLFRVWSLVAFQMKINHWNSSGDRHPQRP